MNDSSGRCERGRRKEGLLDLVKREAGGVLSAPDESRGWLLRGARSVRRHVESFGPRFVVSTGPPHSVHLATWMGMRRSSASWIADFRDPWADTARGHLNVAWVAGLARRFEADVVRSAARVLTTTPELANVLRHRFPGACIDWLPNGVDAETLPARAPRPRDFSILHLGTLYHRRDPTPAVRAFARFLRMNGDRAEPESALRFMGHAEASFEARVQSVAAEEGVSARVRLEPPLPRDAALQELAGSGVSLVLAQQQETQVPAKIYEAVAMGIPTLVVTEPTSATGAAGRRLGAAVHDPDDVEGMARSLEAAWSGRWDGRPHVGVRVDYADLAVELERILLDRPRRMRVP